MKNNIRFYICFVIVLSLMMTGISISADNVHYEKEIIFNNNSVFTEDEKNVITATLTSEHNTYDVYGLKCTLFGHTYKTEYVTAITHKVFATNPRCLREIYETQICEDCSDTQSRLISSDLITCCE